MAKTNYDAINFKNKDVDKFSSKFGNGDPVVLPPTRVQVDTVDKTNNTTKNGKEKDKTNFKEFVKTSSTDGETSSLSVSKSKAGGVSKDKNYFLSTDKSGSSLSTTKNEKEKITTGPAAERKFSRAVRKNT